MHRLASVLVIATLAVTGVSSCAADDREPAPSRSSVPAERPAPDPQTPEPTSPPQLVDGGGAEQNHEYFDAVAGSLVADGNPGGRTIIDGLSAAGFDKSAMQVTADHTPLGNAVDSLQFSVEFDDGCLIGQVGSGTYTSVLAAPLAGGGCLVGATRPIDW